MIGLLAGTKSTLMVKGGYEGQLLLVIAFEPWLGRPRQIPSRDGSETRKMTWWQNPRGLVATRIRGLYLFRPPFSTQYPNFGASAPIWVIFPFLLGPTSIAASAAPIEYVY